MASGECRGHQTLCNLVKQHHIERGHVVFDHHKYCVGDVEGEIDVLVATPYGLTAYEVKSHNGSRQFKKARDQVRRFMGAYPSINIRGVYVAPNAVRRIKA